MEITFIHVIRKGGKNLTKGQILNMMHVYQQLDTDKLNKPSGFFKEFISVSKNPQGHIVEETAIDGQSRSVMLDVSNF